MLDPEDSVAVWEMTVDSYEGYLIVIPLRFMKQILFRIPLEEQKSHWFLTIKC